MSNGHRTTLVTGMHCALMYLRSAVCSDHFDIGLNKFIVAVRDITWYLSAWFAVILVYLDTHCSTSLHATWKRRWLRFNVSPQTLTWEFFHRPHMVYSRVSLRSRHSYIGVCEQLGAREHSRMRKMRQLSNGKHIHAEGALQFWLAHDNYHEWIAVPIASHATMSEARTVEASLQHEFASSLNHPYIWRHFSPTWKAASHRSLPPTSFRYHKRMWRRVRRRHGKLFWSSPRHQSHRQCWELLLKLAGRTYWSYRAQRYLRTRRFHDMQIYALYRAADSMEETAGRCRVLSLLHRVMKFRRMRRPPQGPPVALPPILVPSWFPTIRRWLQTQLQAQPSRLTPLHWPRTVIMEGSNQSVGQVLHNWRWWMRKFALDGAPPCACHLFRHSHPDAPRVQDHVIMPAEAASTTLSNILQLGAKDTFYPGRNHYMQATSQIFAAWFQRQGLDWSRAESSWQQLVRSAWPQHASALTPRHIQWSAVSRAKQDLKHMVVACEDHEPHKLNVYCPLAYYNMVRKTFSDPEVFAPVHGTVLGWQEHITRMPRHLRMYAWGLNRKSMIPSSYVLPKSNKLYAKGRPIINFRASPFRLLWTGLGHVLNDMCTSACPYSFHSGSMPQMIGFIHVYLAQCRNRRVVVNNTDLVGFFTSVPQDRIIQAVNHMVQAYWDMWGRGRPMEMAHLTVMQKDTQKKHRTFAGRRRCTESIARTFRLVDIIDLVELAMATSVFEVLGTPFRQVRGACIGMQASPPLCNITAAWEEWMWARTYGFLRHQRHLHGRCRFLFVLRYVDNRLTIHDRCLDADRAIKDLIHLDFYRDPVQLEHVGDMKVLGYTLDVQAGTMRMLDQQSDWRIRHPHSATSTTRLLSGFKSRLHLVLQGVYPRSLRPSEIQKLIDKYVARGYSRRQLTRIAESLDHRCRNSSFPLLIIVADHASIAIRACVCVCKSVVCLQHTYSFSKQHRRLWHSGGESN